MINAIPFVGWILSLMAAWGMAVPFWFCWTSCELGSFYFGEYLPERFHALPFWNIVGLFTIFSILNAFVPKFVSVSNDNNKS